MGHPGANSVPTQPSRHTVLHPGPAGPRYSPDPTAIACSFLRPAALSGICAFQRAYEARSPGKSAAKVETLFQNDRPGSLRQQMMA